MRIPLVAIIGLPNTGKSTLFNKVLHQHKALVHGVAGTTRDRAYGLTEWNGLPFYLIDTAGIIQRPDSELEKNIQKQTAIARDEADLILYMVDGQTPVGHQDLQVASQLSKLQKPVVLAVNKIDARNTKTDMLTAEYQKLGLPDLFPTSAANGSGVGDLLDTIVEKLKDFKVERPEVADRIKIAFIGRPNVGKSSLINALIKQERMLVSPEAGTTRSTVEIPFESSVNGVERKFLLLDTAGIKKKWKQETDVAAAAAFQSIRTLTNTDVAFFVVDATQEIQVGDQTVAEDILEQHKPVVLLLNKIDQLTEKQQDDLLSVLPDYLPQLWFAPVLFTSAAQGKGLELLLKFAYDVYSMADQEVSAEALDQFLDKILAENMPGKMEDQRSPKIYNIKQTGTRPPVFRITVNFPAAIATAWKRWFEKQFRLQFGFEGTPIVIKYLRKQ